MAEIQNQSVTAKACPYLFFCVEWGKCRKQMLFNIQKKMPRIGSRTRVIYIELGFPGTNIDQQLG